MEEDGEFEDGHLIDGTIFYENGDYYIGKLKVNNKKHDVDGYYVYANGKIY